MAIDTETASRDSAETAGAESLRRKVFRGISWELGGQFGMQGWRFISNLVLTRLLVPDAFGLIGLVQVFMLSLTLLSDVGLQSSVIHDKRGEDRRFLDTVWTVSVVRGIIMWIATCLLAYPFAQFFGMPMLMALLPVTGFSSVIRGFASTRLLTANRILRNDWYVRVDCGSQLIGTLVTVVLAVWWRSVWALAFGWIAIALAFTALSYCHRNVTFNRFCWDRDIVRSLSRFGRWAWFSSGFMILQQRGDRLALGKIISTANLGTYVIGSNLALLPITVFLRLNKSIGQPIYAKVRKLEPDDARSKIRRLRFGIVLTHVPVLAILVVYGQPMVDFLYPTEFAMAGWYCSLAALAGIVRVGSDMGPIFLAHGDSWSHFKIMLARTISLLLAIVVGYFVGRSMGMPANGVLYGMVAAPLLAYPYQAALYRKVNAWLPEVDIVGLVPAGLLILWQLGRMI